MIAAANKHLPDCKLNKVTGDFEPGYFYGNVKTHKANNPLRPIISQVTLPTYTLAKRLNCLLAPYVPTDYSLSSSTDFLDLIHSKKPEGSLASLDVNSLFTNVPVERTIQIVLDFAYCNESLAKPQIPRHIVESMLRLCTSKSPFRCPRGQLYLQIDGVAMGSPLGPLFAQAFMAQVEREVFSDSTLKPNVYIRYVDDILVDAADNDTIEAIKERLELKSSLTFSIEHSVDKKIAFLDVSLDSSSHTFVTDVHRKATDLGKCLGGTSECPDRYKISTISAYVRRALSHCSSWPLVHAELHRIRQNLTNNGYAIGLIDSVIKKLTTRYVEKQTQQNDNIPIRLYYKNTMSPAYKQDEKALKDIIKRNCTPIQQNESVALMIYYQSPNTASLLMTNNLSRDTSTLKQRNIIYRYKCTLGDCELLPNSAYIGLTTTTLSRRLTMHVQQGGPRKHTETEHGRNLTRTLLNENTTILAHESNAKRLSTLEAVYIRIFNPAINLQVNAKSSLALYDGPPLPPLNSV